MPGISHHISLILMYLLIVYNTSHTISQQSKIGIINDHIRSLEYLLYFTTFRVSQSSVAELLEVHKRLEGVFKINDLLYPEKPLTFL